MSRTRRDRHRAERGRPPGADRDSDRPRQEPPSASRAAGRASRTRRTGSRNASRRSILFVELEQGDRVTLFADAPIEAPTVRGFVALLVEGLNGATVEEVLQVPNDLIERIGLPEILGMLRVRGLTGVLRRLKAEVTRAAIAQASAPPATNGQGSASSRLVRNTETDGRIRQGRPSAGCSAPGARSSPRSMAGRSPSSTSMARSTRSTTSAPTTAARSPRASFEGAEIRCPRHGARFDVRTGKALCFPAFEPVDHAPRRGPR